MDHKIDVKEGKGAVKKLRQSLPRKVKDPNFNYSEKALSALTLTTRDTNQRKSTKAAAKNNAATDNDKKFEKNIKNEVVSKDIDLKVNKRIINEGISKQSSPIRTNKKNTALISLPLVVRTQIITRQITATWRGLGYTVDLMSDKIIEVRKKDNKTRIVSSTPKKIPKTVADVKSKLKKQYNFDSLKTDDSTDEEGSNYSDRPEPPGWSLRENREKQIIGQMHVPINILETFFSYRQNVALMELFPGVRLKKRCRSRKDWPTTLRYTSSSDE